MSHAGLSKSYNTVLTLVEKLANDCLDEVHIAIQDPNGYLFSYDNINLSTSIFIEQQSTAPTKVQSGTHGIIYKLQGGNLDALRLALMLAHMQTASDLSFNHDIQPTHEQITNFISQFKVHIVHTLRHHPNFQKHTTDPKLRHIMRWPLPPGYQTQQFPLKISTIDESLITGNLAIHHDTHIVQLGMTYDQLLNLTILSINDQATQAGN